MAIGPWVLKAFLILSTLKFLRGTPFDLFGKTAERKRERQWLADYEALLDEVKDNLSLANLDRAIALLSIPQEIRGFGHVREKAMKIAAIRLAQLKSEFYDTSYVQE
jgi:indolepyruvate ferredoxin oxidoreductase